MFLFFVDGILFGVELEGWMVSGVEVEGWMYCVGVSSSTSS